MMAAFMYLLLFILSIFQVVNCNYEGYQYYRSDPYNSLWKKKDYKKSPPTVGSQDARVNLGKVKQRGSFLWSDLSEETGHTVFKIKLFEERVIITDPIALFAMYDPKLVEKSLDFGLFWFNPAIGRGYYGSASTNDRQHAQKKRGQFRILENALRTYGYDGLFKMLQKQFSSVLPVIKGESVNVENLVDVVTLKVLTQFFLGKEYGDLKTFLTWFLKGLTLKNSKTTIKEDPVIKELTDKIFAYMDETPFVNYKLIKLSQYENDFRKFDELKAEAAFLVFVFAAFGLRSGMNSAIALYLNLEEEDREKIVMEAERFLKNDGLTIKKKLQDLDIINRFALEVFRYFPPVREVFGRARKDFVVESLSGRFQIRKGQFLTGSSYATHRNPKTFRFPKLFTTTGDEKQTKENFFTFGGNFNTKPDQFNRKCLGQDISMNLVKMLVVLVSQCEIVPASDIKFTEKDTRRAVASDEPLKVKKFKCPF